VQMLMIEAASPESGGALHNALSEFGPETATDSRGRCFVWVRIGGHGHARSVHEAIASFMADRLELPVNSTVYALDGVGQP
jgi:hypothetical protein